MMHACILTKSITRTNGAAATCCRVNHVLMPDMDWYVDVQSRSGIPHFYGNWQASIGECMMAMGILSDDRARYTKAVGVFHSTVSDYFKWGRGAWANGRILGECSETLRDQYHVQFGLGGLLQMAEMAWQQDDDLYSANAYVLVAAMELHARINLAGKDKDPNKLPHGFTFFDRMPAPPGGSAWQFDIKGQKWKAIAKDGRIVQELNDGHKYVLGTGFLPTGWELGECADVCMGCVHARAHARMRCCHRPASSHVITRCGALCLHCRLQPLRRQARLEAAGDCQAAVSALAGVAGVLLGPRHPDTC